MQKATIREIAQALTNFCEQFPDLADNKLCVCSESGCTGGVPVLPLRLYRRKLTGAADDGNVMFLYSDDDQDFDWLESRNDIEIFELGGR
jgi:hypothetical protein